MAETQSANEQPANPPADPLGDLPQPTVVRRGRFVPSLIWLVPLVAAIVGIGVLISSYRATGQKITITFQSAEGIEAGKTEVRYKEVVIGHVRGVALSDDNSRVVVHVELDHRAHGFAVADARYWVVRPRVGLGGVSAWAPCFPAPISAPMRPHRRTKRKISPVWKRRPPCCTATRDAASPCAATIWVRSISAHRCITGASAWVASPAINSTTTATR